MPENSRTVESWVKALNQAYRSVKLIASLSDTFGNLSTEDAYQVQFRMLDNRLKQGERLIGWKVGATSAAVRSSFLFPVTEPVFGWMTDKSDYSGRDEISASSFCNLRMEAEIDLVLRAPLKGPGVTNADVINAASGAMAAVELVGGRLKERKTLSDLVADNSGHAGIVLGPFMKGVMDFDLRYESVIISKNGRHEASACGCEVMGNPLNAVSWLANKLAQFGRELSAGAVISTGSLTRVIPLAPGDVVNVSFNNLGYIQFVVTK